MVYSARTPRDTFPAERPLFYYITDRMQLLRETLPTRIRRVARWGVDFIQIREKDLDGYALYELTRSAVAAVRGLRCRILVNGRADVALSAGAHGVHLPSSGMRPGDIRGWVPKGFIIGVSVHSIREALQAAREGADYVLLGPVFRTPSKVAYGRPLGLETLRQTCACVPVPVIGLGGISAVRIDAVIATGAVGIAGIRLFQGSLKALPRRRSRPGGASQ